jgi:hypothetical protein
MQHLSIRARACTNSKPVRPDCKSYPEIVQFLDLNGYLILRAHYLNTIINPASPDKYLDYYL